MSFSIKRHFRPQKQMNWEPQCKKVYRYQKWCSDSNIRKNSKTTNKPRKNKIFSFHTLIHLRVSVNWCVISFSVLLWIVNVCENETAKRIPLLRNGIMSRSFVLNGVCKNSAKNARNHDRNKNTLHSKPTACAWTTENNIIWRKKSTIYTITASNIYIYDYAGTAVK